MKRSEEDIMKLYNDYEKLVYATIYRRYGNPSYMEAHCLTRDDLEQYGRIGLFNACKTYKEDSGFAFATHATRNIIWSINDESKIDSLTNINKGSNEIANRTSLDVELPDSSEEDLTLYDVLESYELGYDEVEFKDTLDSMSSTLPKELVSIVKMRLDGHTTEEIGATLGITGRAVNKRLAANKSKIVELLV